MLFDFAVTSPLQAVRRKFSQAKYRCIAKVNLPSAPDEQPTPRQLRAPLSNAGPPGNGSQPSAAEEPAAEEAAAQEAVARQPRHNAGVHIEPAGGKCRDSTAE